MDRLLTLLFLGMALLFGVWILSSLVRYAQFRRLSSQRLVVWETPRPWFFGLCLGIGFFMVVLTVMSAFLLRRPPLFVVAQGLMAVFYTVVFPLRFRILKGFYQSGIWAEQGFVAYRDIRWLGWQEKPEITLAFRRQERLLGSGDAFLRVPGVHYGAARRVINERLEDRSLRVEQSVLGLEASEMANRRGD
jgi:hypothetical protein